MLDYLVPVSASMPDVAHRTHRDPVPVHARRHEGHGRRWHQRRLRRVVNAVVAALGDLDWTELRTPLSPGTVWQALQQVSGPRRQSQSE